MYLLRSRLGSMWAYPHQQSASPKQGQAILPLREPFRLVVLLRRQQLMQIEELLRPAMVLVELNPHSFRVVPLISKETCPENGR